MLLSSVLVRVLLCVGLAAAHSRGLDTEVGNKDVTFTIAGSTTMTVATERPVSS
jgi:hypothetical protein